MLFRLKGVWGASLPALKTAIPPRGPACLPPSIRHLPGCGRARGDSSLKGPSRTAATDAPQSPYYYSQGLRLHFPDGGNPQAPPLLLVHGGLDHSRSWDHLARALRRNFHVVAPDLRGHGESEWATGSSYSLADHVYDLTGLVKAAGFENVSIVGHSMGGMVSLTYAGAFPEQVSPQLQPHFNIVCHPSLAKNIISL